jgi:hypothetical protein
VFAQACYSMEQIACPGSPLGSESKFQMPQPATANLKVKLIFRVLKRNQQR